MLLHYHLLNWQILTRMNKFHNIHPQFCSPTNTGELWICFSGEQDYNCSNNHVSNVELNWEAEKHTNNCMVAIKLSHIWDNATLNCDKNLLRKITLHVRLQVGITPLHHLKQLAFSWRLADAQTRRHSGHVARFRENGMFVHQWASALTPPPCSAT